ncbi:hypothetical protein PU99_14240 [Pseudomonas putida]|nr:hypothetical protein PU99_14240 [Pseudomonas putida]
MCPVKPFAFLADDHLRDCLRLRWQPERRLQFVGGDLAYAVGVDDVESNKLLLIGPWSSSSAKDR